MESYIGKWSLITGASSGIGLGFAKELAKRGSHLIVVARRKEKLVELASVLSATCNAKVEVINLDLSQASSAHLLYQEIMARNYSINMLINNAGIGVYGEFHTTDLERNENLIMLNVYSLSLLSHLFMPDLIKNKGSLINVASTAAFQPVPYMATYGASKAYVLSFSEALWAEYRHLGVKVLALCPGPVETEFFGAMKSGRLKVTNLGTRDSVENVVETAFKALDQHKIYTIPGPLRNYFLAQASRWVPRKLAAILSEKVLRPKDP